MKLNVALYYPSRHFKMIESWWESKNFPAPNPKFLPPTGYLIECENLPICAGFLFKTDAKIAIINHVVSTSVPMDKEIRSEALDLLIKTLIQKAERDGFLLVTASSNVERLNQRYEKLGFIKTDSNEDHYGRAL